jgi:hypothetical protein
MSVAKSQRKAGIDGKTQLDSYAINAERSCHQTNCHHERRN